MRVSRILAAAIIALALTGATLASEPGEPLGPEDWVFNEPGVNAQLPFLEVDPPVASQFGNALRSHTGGSFFLLDSGSGNANNTVSSQVIDVTGRVLVIDGAITGVFCGPTQLLDTKLIAMDGDGDPITIGYLRDRCVDPSIPRIDRNSTASVLGLYDPISGTVYAKLFLSQFTPGLAEPPDYPDQLLIIRIHGLPTISDIIPEGPPGMDGMTGPPGLNGPPGPQGPPGLDADESRVLTLEQLMAIQQAEIDALRATLEQVENLPTIQRLLEKVQELEQGATP